MGTFYKTIIIRFNDSNIFLNNLFYNVEQIVHISLKLKIKVIFDQF